MTKLVASCRAWAERIVPYGLYSGLCRALAGCGSVLDLGCGTDSMLRHLAGRHRVIGLDRYLPSLLENRKRTRYAAWVMGDLRALPVGPQSVDAVVALDVIEHLDKDEGERRLLEWEQAARRRVVILTPNGFVPQRASENPWQEHRSGWTAEEFERRGYEVMGVYGWKVLRGPYARLRFRPWWLWEAVSAVSHLATARHPRLAFHLLAVKRLNEGES